MLSARSSTPTSQASTEAVTYTLSKQHSVTWTTRPESNTLPHWVRYPNSANLQVGQMRSSGPQSASSSPDVLTSCWRASSVPVTRVCSSSPTMASFTCCTLASSHMLQTTLSSGAYAKCTEAPVNDHAVDAMLPVSSCMTPLCKPHCAQLRHNNIYDSRFSNATQLQREPVCPRHTLLILSGVVWRGLLDRNIHHVSAIKLQGDASAMLTMVQNFWRICMHLCKSTTSKHPLCTSFVTYHNLLKLHLAPVVLSQVTHTRVSSMSTCTTGTLDCCVTSSRGSGDMQSAGNCLLTDMETHPGDLGGGPWPFLTKDYRICQDLKVSDYPRTQLTSATPPTSLQQSIKQYSR